MHLMVASIYIYNKENGYGRLEQPGDRFRQRRYDGEDRKQLISESGSYAYNALLSCSPILNDVTDVPLGQPTSTTITTKSALQGKHPSPNRVSHEVYATGYTHDCNAGDAFW